MHPGNYQDLGTTELIQGMISLDVFFDSTFEAVPQINVIVFSLVFKQCLALERIHGLNMIHM